MAPPRSVVSMVRRRGDHTQEVTSTSVAAAAVPALAAWYEFSTSVLEAFRAELNAAGRECSAEPYVYVGPWNMDGHDGEFWNAPFGAALLFKQLLTSHSQGEEALSFLRRGADLA